MSGVFKRFWKRLPKKPKILLLCHANADLDSVGSTLGFYFSLSKKARCVVGVGSHANQTAASLARHFGVLIQKDPALDDFDAVICCDFNASNRLGPVLESRLAEFKKPVLVIDHHPKIKESFKTAFWLVKPNALSASELAFDELLAAKILVPKNALLCLACGMVSDSADLQIANADLLNKLFFCLKKTNATVSRLRELYAVSKDRSERLARIKSLHRAEWFEFADFLVAVSHVDFFESQSADALITAGADISLVAGVDRHSGVCRLSVRAGSFLLDQTGFHAGQMVCQPLGKIVGGFGSGHAGAAGFASSTTKPPEALEAALGLITSFLKSKDKTKTVELKKLNIN